MGIHYSGAERMAVLLLNYSVTYYRLVRGGRTTAASGVAGRRASLRRGREASISLTLAHLVAISQICNLLSLKPRAVAAAARRARDGGAPQCDGDRRGGGKRG